MVITSTTLPPARPRRVSYVLPPPSAAPPNLALPPLTQLKRGLPGPFYEWKAQQDPNLVLALKDPHGTGVDPSAAQHPRHRLAVQALALDLSTALGTGEGGNAPEGILYTGGRDGLICSWELGLPTKKRLRRYGKKARWTDEDEEEGGEDEDDELDGSEEADRRREDDDGLDGELELDDAAPPPTLLRPKTKRKISKKQQAETLSVEEQWEIDDDRASALAKPPNSRFRQCIQSHTDWVNDIVLCDYNRTLVSASSDSIISAWRPHSSDHHEQMTPMHIGKHGDYVRALACARDAGWVASGGFDRKIKLWDIAEGRSTLELPSAPSSIYSLTATFSGSLLAAGSPERVIRVYDPRSAKQVAALAGHTDNVRAIVIGEDEKWVLSASADSTVKLWSLAAQKCLHTFAHHNTSVWSLFSQHPTLDIFYSGDRDGNICKIDLEGTGDPSEGECIVLARDSDADGDSSGSGHGITQLVAQDDSYVWSAGGSSSVKRWKDVPSRVKRMPQVPSSTQPYLRSMSPASLPGKVGSGTTSPIPLEEDPTSMDGIPFESLVTLESPEDTYVFPGLSSRYQEGDGATIHSTHPALSRSRLPNFGSSFTRPASFRPHSIAHSIAETTHSESQVAYLARRKREAQAVSKAAPLRKLPDDVIAGRTGLLRCELLNDRRHCLTLDTNADVGLWDIVEGRCLGKFLSEDLSQPLRDDNSTKSSSNGSDGGGASKDVLEFVRDRIEGEAAIPSWCKCDTRVGALTIHLEEPRVFEAEVYVDEAHLGQRTDFPPDHRIVLGKWVLHNLFEGFINAELELRAKPNETAESGKRTMEHPKFISLSDLGRPGPPRSQKTPGMTIALATPALSKAVLPDLPPNAQSPISPRNGLRELSLTTITQSPGGTPNLDGGGDHSQGGFGFTSNGTGNGTRTPTAFANEEGNYFSLPVSAEPTESTAFSPTGGASPLPTPGGKNRFRLLGKGSKRPAGDSSLDSNDSKSNSVDGGLRLQLGDAASDDPTKSGANTPKGGRTPVAGSNDDASNYFSIPTSPTTDSGAFASPGSPTAPLPTPGGTLMGRLRFLGKNSKRPTIEIPTAVAPTEVAVAPTVNPSLSHLVREGPHRTLTQERMLDEERQRRTLAAVFAQPITPCSTQDAPPLRYRESMAVIISEETKDASAWAVTYRGLVSTGHEDVNVLEEKAPFWLLDLLLGGRVPAKDPVKIAFIIQAWGDPEKAELPELPKPNARLTANRTLRISKVIGYVADQLDLRHLATGRSASISSAPSDPGATSARPSGGRSKSDFSPEDELEILCCDVVLPLKMSLAVVRGFYWKNGGDVILTYRKRTKAV